MTGTPLNKELRDYVQEPLMDSQIMSDPPRSTGGAVLSDFLWLQERQKVSNKVEPLEAVEEAAPAAQPSDEPPKPAKDRVRVTRLRKCLPRPLLVGPQSSTSLVASSQVGSPTFVQAFGPAECPCSSLRCTDQRVLLYVQDNYMEPDKVVVKTTPLDDDDGKEPEDLLEGKLKDEKGMGKDWRASPWTVCIPVRK